MLGPDEVATLLHDLPGTFVDQAVDRSLPEHVAPAMPVPPVVRLARRAPETTEPDELAPVTPRPADPTDHRWYPTVRHVVRAVDRI